MKTAFVTIGIGPLYEKVAALAAKLFTKVNGSPVRIITEEDLPKDLSHPWFAKAYIWDVVDPDVDYVMYFDADVMAVNPLGKLPEGTFIASKDGGISRFIRPDYQKRRLSLGLDLDNYFNSGLFLCSRETIPMFNEFKTYKHDPDKYGTFTDQNVLNMLVMKHFKDWSKFPINFVNVLDRDNYKTRLVKMRHMAGGLAHKGELVALLEKEIARPPLKKTTVYAISKNEEKFAERFMYSVQEADEVVVLDTGSTDKTVELLKNWGAIVHETQFKPWTKLEEYDALVASGDKPFRFDTARNMALDLVSDDTEICISLDVDELLPLDWRDKVEKAWAPGTNRLRYIFGWKMDANYKPEIFFTYSKIHSRQGYEWRFPAHEYIFTKKGVTEQTKHLPDFIVAHYPDDTKSRSYYKHLLELGVRENPNSERAAYYYGRELIFTREYERGIAELKRYLNLPTAVWPDERAKACKFIANAYDYLRKHDQVIAWLLHSVAEQPGIRDNWVVLAETYCALKDYVGGYYAARQALKIKECKPSHTTSAKCWGSFPHEIASVCAFQLGLKEQAAQHLQNALRYSPDDPELLEKKKMLEEEACLELPVIKLTYKKKSCLSTGVVEGVS